MSWSKAAFVAIAFVLSGAFAIESGKPHQSVPVSQPAASDPQITEWAAAMGQRSHWPKKVRLLRECAFSIVLGGVKKGSVKLPVGAEVDILGVEGENLQVSTVLATGPVHYASTDLLSFLTLPARPAAQAVTPALASRNGIFSGLAQFKVLPFGDIKPGGWIREQMLRDMTSGNSSYLENMRPLGAPISFTGRGRGYGEFEGNFADALIRNAILTGHKPLLDRAKIIADFIVSKQDEQGSVGRKRAENFQAMAQNESELWSQCCFLRAFLAYYEYSKDKKYLDCAVKSVDFIMSVFGDEKNKYFVSEDTMEGGARAHGLMYIDVLEKIYQLTGDKKYLGFAFRIYEDYSTSKNLKNTDHQMGALLDKNALFQHHAPHAAEHSRVIYWLSSESKDPRYKEAATNSLGKLLASLSPCGGLVTDDQKLESVGGQRGSSDLRYEYCSITETAISLESAFQKFGDISIAEKAENTVFNAAQAARFANGKANAYLSKDNQVEAAGDPESASFRRQYAACHRIACCVYNVNRVMPYYVSGMWLKTGDEKSLVAAFYGPSTLNTKISGVDIEITQQTLYPFANDITMTINPAREISVDIFLRVPSWSVETSVLAPGAAQSRKDGYIKLSKAWTKGDTIKIQFTPKNEIKTDDGREFYVKRGALLYALGFAHTQTPEKTWEGTDFANYDIRLARKDDAKKYADVKFPPGQASKADPRLLNYSSNPKASAQFPFDSPYGFISVKLLRNGAEVEERLVPVGSTLLRKVSFGE